MKIYLGRGMGVGGWAGRWIWTEKKKVYFVNYFLWDFWACHVLGEPQWANEKKRGVTKIMNEVFGLRRKRYAAQCLHSERWKTKIFIKWSREKKGKAKNIRCRHSSWIPPDKWILRTTFVQVFLLLILVPPFVYHCLRHAIVREWLRNKREKKEKIKSTENTNGGADPKAAVPRPGAIPAS